MPLNRLWAIDTTSELDFAYTRLLTIQNRCSMEHVILFFEQWVIEVEIQSECCLGVSSVSPMQLSFVSLLDVMFPIKILIVTLTGMRTVSYLKLLTTVKYII